MNTVTIVEFRISLNKNTALLVDFQKELVIRALLASCVLFTRTAGVTMEAIRQFRLKK